MKAKNRKKCATHFRRVKPHKEVLSEQYQTQAQGGIEIVIRRRKGKQDKRIHFSKQVE
ncbi:MAG: hypothetical protein WBB70_03390 [Desulfobacterales bacterium]